MGLRSRLRVCGPRNCVFSGSLENLAAPVNARPLKERAEQLNSQIGELPKFVPGGYFIQQGNMALYFHFDKPIMNRADNALLLSVGPAPNTMYLFGNAPQPVRRKLHAAAADDMSSIVWVSSRLRSYSYPTSATSFALAGLQVTFAW